MMNGTSIDRPRCFVLRSDGLRRLLTLSVFAASATWCWADEPTGSPPEKKPSTVSLNQSVSVEAVGLSGGSESSEATPAGASAADPASRSGVVAPVSSTEPKPRTSFRGRRKPPVAAGRDRAVKNRATPWYQSGIGALSIVLGVVGVLVWAVRRWVPAARSGGSSAIRVSGRVNLTPKHSITLVHVGRRYLLIGLSGDRMTTLSEISDPNEVADLAALVNESGTRPPDGFDELLMSEATDFRSTTVPEQADTTPVKTTSGGGRRLTGLQDLVDRLKSLQTK